MRDAGWLGRASASPPASPPALGQPVGAQGGFLPGLGAGVSPPPPPPPCVFLKGWDRQSIFMM